MPQRFRPQFISPEVGDVWCVAECANWTHVAEMGNYPDPGMLKTLKTAGGRFAGGRQWPKASRERRRVVFIVWRVRSRRCELAACARRPPKWSSSRCPSRCSISNRMVSAIRPYPLRSAHVAASNGPLPPHEDVSGGTPTSSVGAPTTYDPPLNPTVVVGPMNHYLLA